jgi:hypothetical protein
MYRLLILLFLTTSLALTGCPSSGTNNVLKNADQEAIDAYNQAIAEGEASTVDY